MKPALPFRVAAAVESGLLVAAAGLSWILALPAGRLWGWADIGWGVAGAAPMLAGFWWLMQRRDRSLLRIREFVVRVLRPALEGWSTGQLLAIALLAGVAEEWLFRGVLQAGMARALGPVAALLLASALFGVCHWITPAYALVAGVMGCYLGVLWWWRDGLLTPAISHAVYDAVALVWLIKVWKPADRDFAPANPRGS